MNFKQLDKILETGSRAELEEFCNQNDLYIKDEKIFHKNPKEIQEKLEYWDKRQLVKKINLNS